MRFEWDKDKDRENRKKHGVSFSEVEQIFEDPLHYSIMDKRFNYFEERWITIGSTIEGVVLIAGHLYRVTDDGDEVIRVITARKATAKERNYYETIG